MKMRMIKTHSLNSFFKEKDISLDKQVHVIEVLIINV